MRDARSALRQVREELWRLTGDELAAVMTEVEDLRRASEAMEVAVAREALSRGETGPSAPAPLAKAGVTGWIAHRFDQCSVGGPPEPGHVSTLAAVATELGSASDGREVLAEAVTSGVVSPRAARLCLSEVDRLRDLLADGAAPAVWNAYASLAATQPLRVVGRLREAMLARYGHDDKLARDHGNAARHLGLSAARRDGALRKYQLVLDAERAAQLEAAVGALSAPVPEPDGSPDHRSSMLRRAEALMAIVARGGAAASKVPGPTKAAIFLTIDLADLLLDRGGGAVVGSVEDGTILPVGTVRRLACDAWLAPTLVATRCDETGEPVADPDPDPDPDRAWRPPTTPGEHGSILDVGRAERLFTLHQKRGLMIRDRHCTFPGCTTPATWTDAHHLRHWLDGGRTDLSNGALLCGRHHTLVHRLRLAGRITAAGVVEWDLTPDSYDRLLLEADQSPPAARP
jgi:hypothetical protein